MTSADTFPSGPAHTQPQVRSFPEPRYHNDPAAASCVRRKPASHLGRRPCRRTQQYQLAAFKQCGHHMRPHRPWIRHQQQPIHIHPHIGRRQHTKLRHPHHGAPRAGSRRPCRQRHAQQPGVLHRDDMATPQTILRQQAAQRRQHGQRLSPGRLCCQFTQLCERGHASTIEHVFDKCQAAAHASDQPVITLASATAREIYSERLPRPDAAQDPVAAQPGTPSPRQRPAHDPRGPSRGLPGPAEGPRGSWVGSRKARTRAVAVIRLRSQAVQPRSHFAPSARVASDTMPNMATHMIPGMPVRRASSSASVKRVLLRWRVR